ncbi:8-oxo-dGTP diphosphatase [Acholeplasma vituli]|uniref:8-oxo-dGTP diphosphatase n=1 Tax=Paracholeplasma vituli TaxID=69473 RepID=A0ABT2PUL4_9MOLU|nr:8-oxo-dGTP diphosphatase [Paracholeplasma vituli]MCU0104638.1 8-oxo-dGTP diphosphatase [Paracholeplasma vituli]
MIYTLAFIRHQNEFLMLNRLKQPWKGCWNGVGGKLEPNETLIDSIQREILEETGMNVCKYDIQYKGKLTWEPNDGSYLHLYLVNVENKIQTPIQTEEGILDWRPYRWIIDFDNLGVAHNIPYFLPKMLEPNRHHYHCIFDGNRLIDVLITPLEDTHA